MSDKNLEPRENQFAGFELVASPCYITVFPGSHAYERAFNRFVHMHLQPYASYFDGHPEEKSAYLQQLERAFRGFADPDGGVIVHESYVLEGKESPIIDGTVAKDNTSNSEE